MKKRLAILFPVLLLCLIFLSPSAWAENSLFRLQFVGSSFQMYDSDERYDENEKPYRTLYFINNSRVYYSDGSLHNYERDGDCIWIDPYDDWVMRQAYSYDLTLGTTQATHNFSTFDYYGVHYYDILRGQATFTTSVSFAGQKGSTALFQCAAQGGSGDYTTFLIRTPI